MTNESNQKLWTVSEVARRAHVTPRTLHHYDRIGLLVPSGRSPAGYRLYSESDLERLYRIQLYKELGFGLSTIARIIDEPIADRASVLRAQREMLVEERRRVDAVIAAVDRALEWIERGKTMSTDEVLDGLDAFARAPADVRAHHARHGGEAKERWGDTEAYRESMRRARRYKEAEWQRIRAESERNEARMAELLATGADPDGVEAMAVAEAMRQHIDRWFYPCGHEMHTALAEMYEADPRFREHYENRAAGLAAFVATAIRANARRSTG